jgi:hypothetical protein
MPANRYRIAPSMHLWKGDGIVVTRHDPGSILLRRVANGLYLSHTTMRSAAICTMYCTARIPLCGGPITRLRHVYVKGELLCTTTRKTYFSKDYCGDRTSCKSMAYALRARKTPRRSAVARWMGRFEKGYMPTGVVNTSRAQGLSASMCDM